MYFNAEDLKKIVELTNTGSDTVPTPAEVIEETQGGIATCWLTDVNVGDNVPYTFAKVRQDSNALTKALTQQIVDEVLSSNTFPIIPNVVFDINIEGEVVYSTAPEFVASERSQDTDSAFKDIFMAQQMERKKKRDMKAKTHECWINYYLIHPSDASRTINLAGSSLAKPVAQALVRYLNQNGNRVVANIQPTKRLQAAMEAYSSNTNDAEDVFKDFGTSSTDVDV